MQKERYFYQHDFSEDDKSYGSPALEFNEQNGNGILSILESGLIGKVVQFVKNNKILKSKLYISQYDQNFSYSYGLSRRGFWNKIFGQKIDGIETREIELNKIFNGIKNVLQHRIKIIAQYEPAQVNSRCVQYVGFIY